jgi:hypothetical protein
MPELVIGMLGLLCAAADTFLSIKHMQNHLDVLFAVVECTNAPCLSSHIKDISFHFAFFACIFHLPP